MELLLTQAFEESRYHRRFHHTIFILAVTLYTGLLALQLNGQVKICDSGTKWFLVIGVGIIVPAYLCWLIVQYHVTTPKINYVIYKLGTSKYKACRHDPLLPHFDHQALNVFLFKKYGVAVSENKDIKFIGRGHWFFIGIIVLLVAMNAAIF